MFPPLTRQAACLPPPVPLSAPPPPPPHTRTLLILVPPIPQPQPPTPAQVLLTPMLVDAFERGQQDVLDAQLAELLVTELLDPLDVRSAQLQLGASRPQRSPAFRPAAAACCRCRYAHPANLAAACLPSPTRRTWPAPSAAARGEPDQAISRFAGYTSGAPRPSPPLPCPPQLADSPPPPPHTPHHRPFVPALPPRHGPRRCTPTHQASRCASSCSTCARSCSSTRRRCWRTTRRTSSAPAGTSSKRQEQTPAPAAAAVLSLALSKPAPA